jgi:hypothetical protein
LLLQAISAAPIIIIIIVVVVVKLTVGRGSETPNMQSSHLEQSSSSGTASRSTACARSGRRSCSSLFIT